MKQASQFKKNAILLRVSQLGTPHRAPSKMVSTHISIGIRSSTQSRCEKTNGRCSLMSTDNRYCSEAKRRPISLSQKGIWQGLTWRVHYWRKKLRIFIEYNDTRHYRYLMTKAARKQILYHLGNPAKTAPRLGLPSTNTECWKISFKVYHLLSRTACPAFHGSRLHWNGSIAVTTEDSDLPLASSSNWLTSKIEAHEWLSHEGGLLVSHV